jgi:hypothetical protein
MNGSQQFVIDDDRRNFRLLQFRVDDNQRLRIGNGCHFGFINRLSQFN